MIKFQQFFQHYGVRKADALLTFPFKSIKGVEFPQRSIYHYLPSSTSEIGVDANDNFIANSSGLTYCIHAVELKSEEGSPIRTTIVADSMVKALEKKNRSMRRVRQFDTVERDLRALMIFNYSTLQPLYRYRATFLSTWQRWYNIFATFVKTVGEIAEKTQRDQFVRFEVPLVMADIELLRRASNGLTKDVVETLRTPENFFLLELWKWAGDQNKDSIFSSIPEEALAKLNLVVVDGDSFGVLNFGLLDTWRKAVVREDETGEIRGSAEVFQKKLLYFAVQLANLRTATPVSAAVGKMVEKAASTPAAVNQATADVQEEDTVDKLLGNDDVDASKADRDLARLERELEELSRDRGEQALPDLDDDATFRVTSAPVVETVAARTADVPLDDLVGGVMTRANNLLDRGAISVQEFRRFEELSKRYETIPWHTGGTLAEALKFDFKEAAITQEGTTLENSDLSVTDQSMLRSTLLEFDSKYITERLDKDIAACIMSFQRDGVAVLDYQVDTVVDALNRYNVITVKIAPVGGKPTTLTIPIQKPDGDGVWEGDGVRYRLRHQCGDYPIHKTKPTEVALSSYCGKIFVRRSGKVVHDFDRWLQTQIILRAQGEAPVVSDIVYRSKKGKTVTAKLPRVYSGLAARFTEFKVNGWRLSFDYAGREAVFGAEAIARETGGLVAFGVRDDEVLYIDSNDAIYSSSGVAGFRVVGDIGVLLGISLAKAPLEQTEIKLLGKNISLGLVLSYYLGLDELLRTIHCEPRRVPRGTKLNMTADEFAVRFLDEALVFSRQDRAATLLFSGMNNYSRQLACYARSEFNKPDVYLNVLDGQGMNQRFLRELDHLKKYFIDPITLSILKEYNEPTDWIGLLMKSNDLLTDDSVPYKANRFKGYERIAGAVYREIAMAMKVYNGKPLSTRVAIDIRPNAIWEAIQSDPSIALVQDANPIHNLKEQEAITKGGTGGQQSRSLVKSTRVYDPHDYGIVSESTVDSSDVGVLTFFTSDPKLVNVYGMVEEFDAEAGDGLTRVLSTSSNISPGALHDDPKRVNFISIQASSGVSAVGYTHMPLRTGYDQVIAHRVSKLYAFSTKQPGVVKELTADHLLVEYIDGSLHAVKLGREYGRSEGHIIPHMVVTDVSVGYQFQKNEVLAWNDGWFVRDFLFPTQVLYKAGTLMQMAILDEGCTYEDSSAISKEASKRLHSWVTHTRTIMVRFDQKISNLVREGEDVDGESILCTIEDALTADSGLFNDNNLEMLKLLSAQTPRAKLEGKVERIEVLYRGDREDMSESLQDLVGLYDRRRASIAKKLRRGDATTGAVLDRVRVDGYPLEPDTVAIRIYITHLESMGVGDKGTFSLQLKSTHGEVFDGVNESESGVKIDAFFSNMSIFNRIVGSAYEMGVVIPLLLKGSKNAAKIYRGEAL